MGTEPVPPGSRGYGEDVAHVHDTGHAAFAETATAQVVAWLHARGIDGGLVVDLGCGGGQSARILVDAGFDVLGIDQSDPLVRRARARVPEAAFRVGSFIDAELPRCVAVTAIGEVLTYTFDPRHGHAALPTLFARVREALEPGGLFVFDLLSPTGRAGAVRSWAEGDDWAVLVERQEAPDGRRLRRRIVSFRRLDASWRRSEEVHDVLLVRSAEVLAALRAAGFRARARRAYAGERFQPGHTVYVARR